MTADNNILQAGQSTTNVNQLVSASGKAAAAKSLRERALHLAQVVATFKLIAAP